jgi:integrase
MRLTERLTAATIRPLVCPPGQGEETFWDPDIPGFGLRVRNSGSRTWLFQYARCGKTRKMFLGSPDVVDAGKARATVKDYAAQVRLGRDPAVEKAESRVRAAETMGALLPRFLERQRARLRPASVRATERHLLGYLKPLHGLPVEQIDRRVIAKRLMEIAESSGPASSNLARASLSAFLMWCAKAGFIDSNPVALTDKAIAAGERTRVLSDKEIKRIWLALRDDDYGAIMKLLILIGARREEVGALRWSEIDLEAATIALPPARTKNKREHVIPLPPQALAILSARAGERTSAEFVFSGVRGRPFRNWSHAKHDLDQRLAAGGEVLPTWTAHDFRRSLSTALHDRFHIQPHVVETILGHVGGHKRGVAGVYNRALYLTERRRALERWGEHVMALVRGEPAVAQVVKLR